MVGAEPNDSRKLGFLCLVSFSYTRYVLRYTGAGVNEKYIYDMSTIGYSCQRREGATVGIVYIVKELHKSSVTVMLMTKISSTKCLK
jgi:hypothetical protein